MSQRTSGLRAVLSLPVAYKTAQRAIGSPQVRETFVQEHVQPVAGQRVLDVGCGTGDILDHLPAVEYVGFDVSESYVSSARAKFAHRGRFFVSGVDDVSPDCLGGRFDRVMAKGVLHHISDRDADSLFRLAASAITEDGSVSTIDPCFHDGQHPVAKFVASRDRGQAVRRPDAYAALAEAHFNDVQVTLHTDLLRLPYSHAVVTARNPRK